MDESILSTESPDNSSTTVDDDLRKWLKNCLQTVEMNLKKHLDEKCEKFFEQIKLNTITANEALATSKRNATDIIQQAEVVLETNNKLVDINSSKPSKIHGRYCFQPAEGVQALKLNQMEYRLENQTNRNSRKSLTIRGVDEQNERTWETTRQVVCEKLGEITDISPGEVSRMIERVHRSPAKPHPDGRPRTIHALFYDWNDSERIKSIARKNCATHNVYVEQRYGPDTQHRQNQAMILRKQLKTAGTITAGFVAYPAKLMVKYNQAETKYTLHQDFSKMPVPLRRVVDDEL